MTACQLREPTAGTIHLQGYQISRPRSRRTIHPANPRRTFGWGKPKDVSIYQLRCALIDVVTQRLLRAGASREQIPVPGAFTRKSSTHSPEMTTGRRKNLADLATTIVVGNEAIAESLIRHQRFFEKRTCGSAGKPHDLPSLRLTCFRNRKRRCGRRPKGSRNENFF